MCTSKALQIKPSIIWHVSVWYLTQGSAATTLSTGSQRERDFMQNTSAGENSCSLLSKTVVRLSIPLTEGIHPSLPSNTKTVSNFISFMCATCHVSAVCLCSIPHDTVQRTVQKEKLSLRRRKVPTGRLRKPSR